MKECVYDYKPFPNEKPKQAQSKKELLDLGKPDEEHKNFLGK
jgi:hypothetical protein